MSVPTYDSYKESGVEWLGEVPSHWTIAPLKRSIEFTTGWTPPTGRDEFYDGDQLWANISDLNGRYLEDTAKKITEAAVVAANMKPSPVGSLIFSFKLSIGQVAFARRDMFTNEAIATFLPSADVDLSFAYYAFPLFVVANAAENIYGAKLLNQELIRNATLALPPLAEQAAIAAFLDRETGKIDALVEAQTRLIELLKEKRQAVISHAVTKGLDPAAPMKDSGVEWLGLVPAHWDVASLVHLVDPKRYITYGIVQPGPSDPDGRFMVRGQDYSRGWVAPDEIFRVSTAVEEPYRRARLAQGDLIMTIVGAGVGNIAAVPAFLDGANITQTTARIAPNPEKVDPGFLREFLTSSAARNQVGAYQKGAAQPGLNIEHLKAFRVPLPPLAEQALIAAELTRRAAHYGPLILEAEAAIPLLQERRAALISAAVTGKIDVRGLAPEQAEAA